MLKRSVASPLCEHRRAPVTRLLVLILVVMVSIAIPGCWDRRELEDIGFILAVGLDKGETAPIRATLQVAVPALLAPGRSGGGPGVITEVSEGATVTDIINTLTTIRHKEISLEQNKIVVIGRGLAEAGILEQLGELVRSREFRRTNFLVVATGTAEEALGLLTSERNPAAAIEELVRLAGYTGLAPVVTVHDWLTTYETPGAEAVAPIIGPPRSSEATGLGLQVPGATVGPGTGQGLGGMGGGGAGSAGSLGGRSLGGGSSGGGQSSGGGAEAVSKIQVMGTAIFSGDRLVDFISARETQVFLLMRGWLKRTVFTFVLDQPPATVSVTVKGSKPRAKLTFEGDLAVVKDRLVFEGDLAQFVSREPFLTKPVDLNVVTHQMNLQLKAIVDGLLQRTQGLGTDIFGFGLQARRLMPNFDAWINFDWPSYYRRAEINVEVQSFVRRTGTTLSPLEELPVYRRQTTSGGGSQ